MVIHLWRDWSAIDSMWWQGRPGQSSGAVRWLGDRVAGDPFSARAFSIVGPVWMAALSASYLVRRFLVEYVGDVAAYVSSNAVDRFYRLRRDIQEVCAEVVGGVYRDRQYSACVLVGHSLGSVVAYDTLNALINEDLLAREKLDICRRTRLFLTLGSPLDKTAFTFRTQRPERASVREALAAAVQPLIVDYRYRPSSWINVWSRNDWISGPLDYYDDPGRLDPRRVVNREDREASIPLVAHTQYWTHEVLGTALYRAVVSSPAVADA